MPGIFDNKLFNAEVFQKYVDRIPNLNRNELIRSRAVRPRPDLAAAMADQVGGNYLTTPLYGLINGAEVQNYDGNTDTLAMTVCIQPGESASISLPAGSYRMNEAHGERWFGEEEMFGDDGNYYHCIFGGEDTADLEWGYSYEISTSYGYNFDGTGIRSEAIDRDSF